MKLTDWFPPDIKPCRKGVYETWFRWSAKNSGYSYWNGTSWSNQFRDKDSCYWDIEGVQSKNWRGITI